MTLGEAGFHRSIEARVQLSGPCRGLVQIGRPQRPRGVHQMHEPISAGMRSPKPCRSRGSSALGAGIAALALLAPLWGASPAWAQNSASYFSTLTASGSTSFRPLSFWLSPPGCQMARCSLPAARTAAESRSKTQSCSTRGPRLSSPCRLPAPPSSRRPEGRDLSDAAKWAGLDRRRVRQQRQRASERRVVQSCDEQLHGVASGWAARSCRPRCISVPQPLYPAARC